MEILNCIDKINDNHIISIVGYGMYGKFIYKIVKRKFNDIEIVVYDNNIKDEYETGKFVVPVSRVKNDEKAIFIIASTKERIVNELYQELICCGIDKSKIIKGVPEEIINLKERERIELRKKPITLDELKFEVNIVKHCNLNCKSCCHFAPLAKEEYMDVYVYKDDINRMSYLFNGKAKRIMLLGGEPLLHPDIINFMKYTREAFKEACIEIITNGLLIKEMSDDFFDACSKYEVKIVPTQYPIDLDYQKLGEYVKQKGVEYYLLNEEAYKDIKYRDKSFIKYPIDFDKSQRPDVSYENCSMSECVTLDNGKLYTCSLIPNVHLFNNYFNKNLKITENDYVDIYKDNDKEKILRKLSIPVEFCRYCKTTSVQKFSWGISKRSIKEWSE